tara:strand:+ start:11730 stop:12899 length:1170 start_codon:yes stop_codon:yes gene_type:complete
MLTGQGADKKSGKDDIRQYFPGLPRRITVNQILEDSDMLSIEGDHIDALHYSHVVDYDCDAFTDSGNLLFKFRKGAISQRAMLKATAALVRVAKPSRNKNRGAASGPLDRDLMPDYVGEFVRPQKFRTKYTSTVSGVDSKQWISNAVSSNIMGFYDKPDRNRMQGKPDSAVPLSTTALKCRKTAFTRDHSGLWNTTLPLLTEIDNKFKELMSDRHSVQRARCQATPEFAIGDTAFSTCTVNYSFRTATHKDSGDFEDGFGTLVVVEDKRNPNAYDGCFTGFPQYGVAVDVRHGDFLAMDVHQYHCNTEFSAVAVGASATETSDKNASAKAGGAARRFNRMAIVAYLRSDMLKCAKSSVTFHPQCTARTKVKPTPPHLRTSAPPRRSITT